jgi:hypothetical protein
MRISRHAFVRTAGAIGIAVLLCGTGDVGADDPAGSDPPDGELVDQFERRNRAFEGFLRAEVTSALNRARDAMGTRPAEAVNTLELLLDKVRRASDVSPEMRSQLVSQIESALRLAHRQQEIHVERQMTGHHIAAQNATRSAADHERSSNEQKLAQYLERINALMAEGRYRDAEALASVADEALPGHAALHDAVLAARTIGYTADMNTLRGMRAKGFVDTMYQVELSHVPTPDQPPILYPDPEVWQSLTSRRKKHAVDVKPWKPNELKILDEFDETTECDFFEQPLSNVIDYFKERHGIEIQLDKKALNDAGVDGGTLVTRSVKGITLRSALKLILHELDLTYVIRTEVLLITSKTAAESIRDIRVYPVADLMSRGYMRQAYRRYGIQNMSRASAAGFGAF